MGRLLQAAAALPPNGAGKSSIDVWATTLTDEDRADVEKLLADRSYGHTQVAALIRQVLGQSFTAETIRRYRVKRL